MAIGYNLPGNVEVDLKLSVKGIEIDTAGASTDYVLKFDGTKFAPSASVDTDTLASDYAAATSSTDNLLLLTSSKGPLDLQDAASTIGTLLRVKTNGGTALFEVNGTSGLTLGANVSLSANKNITAAAGSSAVDFSSATGTFKTSTGANTLGGNTTVASGKSLSSAGGAANFDWSASSGTFATSTGTNTLEGDVTVASGKSVTSAGGAANLDFSASSGLTKTGTGAVSLNGDTTVAAGKVLTVGTGGLVSTTTSALAAATADTVAINGATLGANKLAVSGSANISTNLVVGGNLTVSGTTTTINSTITTIADPIIEVATSGLTAGGFGGYATRGVTGEGGSVTSMNWVWDDTLKAARFIFSGDSSANIDTLGYADVKVDSSSATAFTVVGKSILAAIDASGNINQTGATTFSTGTGTVSINGATTVASGKSLSSAGGAANFDWSASSGTFKTSTGAVSINGTTTLASGKSLSSAGGAANLDFSASSGTFDTSSGAVTIHGNTTTSTGVTITSAGGAGALDFSAASGVFYTSTGANHLNGTVTVASGKSVTSAGGAADLDWSASSGLTKTGTGAVTINGDVTRATNKNDTATAGTGAFDWSAATGIFKTSTGANTLGGNTTVASGKSLSSAGGAANFDWSASSGTFKTSTGAATLNGDTTVAAGKVFTVGTGGLVSNTSSALGAATASTMAINGATLGSNKLAVTGSALIQINNNQSNIVQGLELLNDTLTNGTILQQNSPSLNLRGHVWLGSADEWTEWQIANASFLNGSTVNRLAFYTQDQTSHGGAQVEAFAIDNYDASGIEVTELQLCPDNVSIGIANVRMTAPAGVDHYLQLDAINNNVLLNSTGTMQVASSSNMNVHSTGGGVTVLDGTNLGLYLNNDGSGIFQVDSGHAALGMGPGQSTFPFNAAYNGFSGDGTLLSNDHDMVIASNGSQSGLGAITLISHDAWALQFNNGVLQLLNKTSNSTHDTYWTFGATGGFLATSSATGNYDFSPNTTGLFKTSGGANTLSGNTTVASGKSLSSAGGAADLDWSASSGLTKTGTGAVTINGNTTLAAAKTLTAAAGAGALDFSSATGIFSTSTGANTLGGNTTVASAKSLSSAGGAANFDWSASSGTFQTSTGAVSLKGNTTVVGTNTFTIGTVQIDPSSPSTGSILRYNGTKYVSSSLTTDASDTQLTTTSPTSIVTLTPTAQGNYVVYVYYRVVTAPTDVTIALTWTDGSGAQSQNLVLETGVAVGSDTAAPVFLNSTASAITVTATTGTANQLFVSARISSV